MLFKKPRILLLLLGWLLSLSVSAAIIQWDGEGADGQWNTATNWVGNVVPGVTDDVILNNNFLAGSYTVLLPAGAITVSVVTLTITPSGANLITLHLPVTNTADPGLIITGGGETLILNNNGWLRNSSGAASGTGVAVSGIFRVNNGGRYIHNTIRGHVNLLTQLSVSVGTELGTWEFDVPAASYILSLSGRTYGTLMLSSAAVGGNATYLGSGSVPCNIRGDLVINPGVNFSLSMSAELIIGRHYDQAVASLFDMQTAANNNTVRVAGNFTSNGIITETGTGISLFELNGATQQLVDGSGATILNFVEFRLNNPAGASLNGPLFISYLTSIQSGNFLLNNFNLSTNSFNSISPPTLTSNHIVTNGSGELVLVVMGATPTVFPVGPSINTYNPITINSPGTASFGVRVEIGINPPIAFPTYGINRTWNLRAPAGPVANINVIFQYASADANAGAPQPQDMEILMFSGMAWNIISGNTNITPGGADPAWTVATTNAIGIPSNAMPFALGVDGGWILPLRAPVLAPDKPAEHDAFIYPTLIKETGTFKIQALRKELFSLSIVNVSGQLLKKWQVNAMPGENKIELRAGGLKSGIYFLVIRSGTGILIRRFMKE